MKTGMKERKRMWMMKTFNFFLFSAMYLINRMYIEINRS